jgi:hypothetical protein
MLLSFDSTTESNLVLVEQGPAFLVAADLALDDAAGQGRAPAAKRGRTTLTCKEREVRIGDEDGSAPASECCQTDRRLSVAANG